MNSANILNRSSNMGRREYNIERKYETNLGYCFVMMVKPKYVIEFYNTFNGKNFKKKNCNKIIQVIWAEQQGDDFLNKSDDPLKSQSYLRI